MCGQHFQIATSVSIVMATRRPAPAVNRAVDLLALLATHPTESFSMSELSRRLGINGASVHAVLGVLEDAGYVMRHPRHRTYTLGAAAVVLGQAALQQHPAITEAVREIEPLSKQLDLEVIVTALAGDSMLYVGSAGPPQPNGVRFNIGQRVPCLPPYGTVHMAWATPAEIEEWLNRSPTPLSPEQVEHQLRVLAAIRRRGYAIGLDIGDAHIHVNEVAAELVDSPRREELRKTIVQILDELARTPYQLEELDPDATYDISMISAPVFDPQGRVAVAITLPGLPRALPASRITEIAESIVRTALVVTKRIHGVVPNSSGPTMVP
ncbi:MAG TPA: MarR family transcriptional regulator [Acidimicrobiales bacterium]